MKKIIKNDEGKVVPEKCDKCGGDVVLQIHGEPVYVCKECGKYFGTMPCNLKENRIMKKNVVKINENALRQIVAESVKKVLKEYEDRSFNSGEFYGEALDTAVQTYLDSLNIEPIYFVTDTEKIGKAFGDKLFEIANQNGNEYRNKLDAARINSTDYHGEGYGGYPY